MSPELQSPTIEEQEKAAGLISTGLKAQIIDAPQTNGIVYDADAPNELRFGGLVEDIFVFATCEPISDERYKTYDERSSLRIVDNGENADTSGSIVAQVALFDDVISDIKGIPGEMPENWKAQLDPDEFKVPIIVRFLAAPAYLEPMEWGKTDRAVILEAWFNRQKIITRHFLRKKTIDDVKAYRKLQKIPIGNRGKGLEGGEIAMQGYAAKKGELYDRMKTKEASGYAGRVPLWHKAAVIDAEFSAGIAGK
jgi:hypothetical protein